MEKQELKNFLNIIIGELKNDVSNDEGCFDEIAYNAMEKILTCNDLLEKNTKGKMVQLDKSVKNENEIYLYIDAIVEDCEDNEHIFLSTSDEDDIWNTEIYNAAREDIIKVFQEVIKMCN
jgi:hypothetical protein